MIRQKKAVMLTGPRALYTVYITKMSNPNPSADLNLARGFFPEKNLHFNIK